MTSDFISKYSLKNTGLLAQEKCVSQLCELDEKTQDFLLKALLGFSQHKVLKLGDPCRDLNKFSVPFMMPKQLQSLKITADGAGMKLVVGHLLKFQHRTMT